MSRFLSWTAAGAVLGYAGVRASEALSDLRSPAVPIERDARRYGRTQRALMLSGIARSLATLATAAYAIGPLLDDDPSRPNARAYRVASAGAAMLATSLLELPSDYVEGFSLERRFGLSKQTGRAWIADQAKGIAVSLAIGLPLLELLASATLRAPRSCPHSRRPDRSRCSCSQTSLRRPTSLRSSTRSCRSKVHLQTGSGR